MCSYQLLSPICFICPLDPWFPDEINNGKAENLFYLLSALMGVFFLGYLVAARLYKYRLPDSAEISVEKETSDSGTSVLQNNGDGDVRENSITVF